MISPYPGMGGGVVQVVETLKRYFTTSHVTDFHVGSQSYHPFFLTRMRDSLKMLFHFIFLLIIHKFDVIHLNPSFNTKSLVRDGALFLIAWILGQENMLVYFHGWKPETAQSPLKRLLFSILFNKAKTILVLAPEFKKQLMEMGIKPEKIFLTRTMADSVYEPANLQAKDYNTILFMSRLEKQKGVHELLAAFATLQQEFPALELVFAGEGREKNALEAKVKQLRLTHKVHFTGYVTGAAKQELLQKYGIFALPTYYPEGMPVALIEAMLAGQVLLTTQAGAIRHIVRDPDNGVVLEVVTPETIAEGLRKLLTNKDYCVKVAIHNAEYASEYFAPDKAAREIEACYNPAAHSFSATASSSCNF